MKRSTWLTICATIAAMGLILLATVGAFLSDPTPYCDSFGNERNPFALGIIFATFCGVVGIFTSLINEVNV